MPIYQRALIALLMIANLALVAIWIARQYATTEEVKLPTVSQSLSLPAIELVDYKGKAFHTSELIGKPMFVQFINPSVEAQVKSFEQVFKKVNESTGEFKPLSWLLFTSDAAELRLRLALDSGSVTIVEREYGKLRKLFDVPGCCERWLVFDETGRFRKSGSYDSGDALSYLAEVAAGQKPFSTGLLLESFREMNNKGYLSSLHRKMSQSKSRKTVIAMFSSVCTGCADGEMVEVLKLHAKSNHRVGHLALVPDTFSQTDLANFKENLGIPFPVEVANGQLAREWSSLSRQFGPKRINGLVFVMSKGEVVSMAQGVRETESLLKGLGE